MICYKEKITVTNITTTTYSTGKSKASISSTTVSSKDPTGFGFGFVNGRGQASLFDLSLNSVITDIVDYEGLSNLLNEASQTRILDKWIG